MLVKLIGIEGPLRGRSRILGDGEWVLGRGGPGVDIDVPDTMVSGSHAKITVTNPQVTVADLDSLNGTYVNDSSRRNRVLVENLYDNDTLGLGPNTAFGVRILPLVAAGFWRRFAAVLIDGLVVLPLVGLGGFLIGLAAGLSYQHAGEIPSFLQVQEMRTTAEVLGRIWGIVSVLGYVVLMNGSRGQTLGKMAMRVKIVHTDGREISYGTAFVRYFMQSLLGTLSLGIMYIFLAAHPEKRGWYDMIADTRVVMTEELQA